ncbi:ABC transporter permease [Micromonospora sp. MW-13]|uniref:ABC transporter permease n=1 Tax=Micromonospora sp. MW-13 TaxID=2094022 RepID=UPI000E4473E4|nr:ABC transporter permease [Micromonospora sp. MW-13]
MRTSSRSSGGRTSRAARAALLAPGLVAIGVSFLVPLAWLARMSLNRTVGSAELQSAVSPQSYVDVLTDEFVWKIAWQTLQLGVLVTVLAIAVSYPIALFLARTRSRLRGLLMALAIAPLLTSSVVRTFGWLTLLSDDGVVNSVLSGLGVTSEPLTLTNNRTGVVIALVEIMMPYAIIAMIAGFGRVSKDLEDAAGSLGAGRLRCFLRITFPLSLPGVLTGALMVFVLTISAFVTPRLMGGGRVFVIATEIFDQATTTLDWPRASALSILLLFLFGVFLVLYQRLFRLVEGR